MLAQGLVAVSKMLPRQRVTSATMYFPKAAAFDAPLDVDVDLLREGRTFSTAEVRISQDAKLRSVGLYFLDSGAPTMIDGQVAMPDVGGPLDAEPYDMRVTGRELRIVNGDYRPDPDHVGPPGDQRVDPVQGRARRSRTSTPRCSRNPRRTGPSPPPCSPTRASARPWRTSRSRRGSWA